MSAWLQISSGRAIPVLPHHTYPGNVILSSKASSGLSPPVHWDPEIEKLSLAHLGAACREALAAVVGPGGGQGSAQHALEEESHISPEGSHGSFDSNADTTIGRASHCTTVTFISSAQWNISAIAAFDLVAIGLLYIAYPNGRRLTITLLPTLRPLPMRGHRLLYIAAFLRWLMQLHFPAVPSLLLCCPSSISTMP